MAKKKVSLVLEEKLLTEAREIAGERRLSAYVNLALRQQLQHDRVTTLLTELEQENVPIDSEVMHEVRAAWPAGRS